MQALGYPKLQAHTRTGVAQQCSVGILLAVPEAAVMVT